MRLIYYKKVSEWTVVDYVKKEVELSDYQSCKLRDALKQMPYDVVDYKKPNPPSFVFRLTIAFYLLFCLCLILFMPFKWISTGSRYYSNEGLLMKIFKKWKRLLSID
jgi:hypothetical protein